MFCYTCDGVNAMNAQMQERREKKTTEEENEKKKIPNKNSENDRKSNTHTVAIK